MTLHTHWERKHRAQLQQTNQTKGALTLFTAVGDALDDIGWRLLAVGRRDVTRDSRFAVTDDDYRYRLVKHVERLLTELRTRLSSRYSDHDGVQVDLLSGLLLGGLIMGLREPLERLAVLTGRVQRWLLERFTQMAL